MFAADLVHEADAAFADHALHGVGRRDWQVPSFAQWIQRRAARLVKDALINWPAASVKSRRGASDAEGWFKVDDWNMNPERGKPWRRYVVVGLLAIVTILVAVAYALSRFAP